MFFSRKMYSVTMPNEAQVYRLTEIQYEIIKSIMGSGDDTLDLGGIMMSVDALKFINRLLKDKTQFIHCPELCAENMDAQTKEQIQIMMESLEHNRKIKIETAEIEAFMNISI